MNSIPKNTKAQMTLFTINLSFLFLCVYFEFCLENFWDCKHKYCKHSEFLKKNKNLIILNFEGGIMYSLRSRDIFLKKSNSEFIAW
jgi:hypothetical protein